MSYFFYHSLNKLLSAREITCNGPSPPLADIVLFGLSLSGFLSRFLNVSAKERFPHPYKGCFVLLPNQCGVSQSTLLQSPASLLAHRLLSTPLRGTTSSLAHRSVSGSDTICNCLSPLLADIVLFRLSLSGFLSRFLNASAREKFRRSYKISCSSPTNVGYDIKKGLMMCLKGI